MIGTLPITVCLAIRAWDAIWRTYDFIIYTLASPLWYLLKTSLGTLGVLFGLGIGITIGFGFFLVAFMTCLVILGGIPAVVMEKLDL